MTGEETSAGGWYSEESATFGDRMAGAREAVGLSQETLAKRLGVKLKTIRAWENDLSEPRANKLQMLAGLLNVSLMWLLTGEGDGLDGPGEGTELPEDLRAVLTDMRQLKIEMGKMGERLGRLEKRLRATLKEEL